MTITALLRVSQKLAILFIDVATTIPKGTTKTFTVRANLSNFSATGNSFQLTIANTSSDASFSDTTTSADLFATNFTGWGLPLTGEVLVKP